MTERSEGTKPRSRHCDTLDKKNKGSLFFNESFVYLVES